MRIKLLRLTATISLCTAFTRAAEQQSVFDKDLVTPAVSHPSQILEHHETVLNVTGRSFDRTVLGYVTPWNSKGAP